MLRSWRISERWGPIAPVRRVEAFREDEPAEREWIRYTPFETRSAPSKREAAASFVPDWSTASLYNETGGIRHLDALEVGSQMDVEI